MGLEYARPRDEEESPKNSSAHLSPLPFPPPRPNPPPDRCGEEKEPSSLAEGRGDHAPILPSASAMRPTPSRSLPCSSSSDRMWPAPTTRDGDVATSARRAGIRPSGRLDGPTRNGDVRQDVERSCGKCTCAFNVTSPCTTRRGALVFRPRIFSISADRGGRRRTLPYGRKRWRAGHRLQSHIAWATGEARRQAIRQPGIAKVCCSRLGDSCSE